MSERSDPGRGFSDEHRAKFFAHLDRLPARDRPVFGFSAIVPPPSRCHSFVDAGTMKLANVPRAPAGVLARFDDHGLAAFNRADLSPEAVRAFFVACSRVLPWPDGLFTEPE